MMNRITIVDDYIPAPLAPFQQDVNDLAYTSNSPLWKRRVYGSYP